MILGALVGLSLTACGGEASNPPAPKPPATAPAPAPAPAPAALAPTLITRIVLFGDSTEWQAAPYWQARYPGVVDNEAVSGTGSGQLIDGTDGQHMPWPAPITSVKFGTAAVFQFGANDTLPWFNTSVDQYKQNLRTLVTSVQALGGMPILETPNPTLDVNRPNEPLYTQAMRDVASELQITLIDTDACWNKRAGGWADLLGPDMEHSTEAGRAWTVDNCVAPVMDALVKQ
jgi:hypothetical protein